METEILEITCFLCKRQSHSLDGFEYVDKATTVNSGKYLRSIIQHLINQAQANLKVPDEALVCQNCYVDLADYDALIIKLVEMQQYFKELFEQMSMPFEVIYNPNEVVFKEDDSCESLTESQIADVVETYTDVDVEVKSENEEPQPKENDEKEIIRIPPKVSNADIIKEFDIKSDIDAGSGSDLEDCAEELLNEINQESLTLSDLEDDIADSTMVVEGLMNEHEMDEAQISKLLDWNALKPHHKCPYCRNKYKLLSNLDEHIEKEHQFGKICQMCGAAVKDDEYLELHMNIHRGKTEYDCCYCTKRYSSKLCVIRHMQKHWDKKKFQCEKCGIRFSETSLLYNHRLQHEAEENPLICEFCDQSFKTKRTYKNHMKTHNENRVRYKCAYCEKTFVEKYTANKHLKKAHPIVEHIADEHETILNPEDQDVIEHDVIQDKEDILNEEDRLIFGYKDDQTVEYAIIYDCIMCRTSFTSQDYYNEHMNEQHGVEVN